MNFFLSLTAMMVVLSYIAVGVPMNIPEYRYLVVKINNETKCIDSDIPFSNFDLQIYVVKDCTEIKDYKSSNIKFMMDGIGLLSEAGTYVSSWQYSLTINGNSSWLTNRANSNLFERRLSWYTRGTVNDSTFDQDGFGPIVASHPNGYAGCLFITKGQTLSLNTMRADQLENVVQDECVKLKLMNMQVCIDLY